MQILRLDSEFVSSFACRLYYASDKKRSNSTVFSVNDNKKIIIEIPRRAAILDVYLEIFDESVGDPRETVKGNWLSLDNGYDVYEFDLSLDVGLYFFRPVADALCGRVFGKRRENLFFFDKNGDTDSLFQLTVCDFAYAPPAEALSGVIYHIFVDRFARGGKSIVPETARIVDDWSMGVPEYPAFPGAPLRNNTFYGGTLWGIAKKLDYIKSLGVNIIYLSPIFESVSNHKYDTADYMTVDKMLGGEAALKHLIKKCNELGIKIILDGVFNHTGDDSIYFNKRGRYDTLGAYNSKESPYFSWYEFEEYPNKYKSWWGIEILPKINTDKPECRRYFTGKGGVIEKYSKMGIYGFRLDVADELSDDFIGDIKSVISKDGEAILYGEVWEDASNKIAYNQRKRYYLGKELDGVMNYPLRTGIIEYLTKKETEALRYALGDIINNAPKRIRDAQMNLLGTHDTDRILTLLGGEAKDGRSNEYLSKKRMTWKEIQTATERIKMAYTILATVPGIPAIFYGDEAGLEGYHDPFNRMPYPWGNENTDILSFYRKIGKIRMENSVYKEGDFSLVHLDEDLLIFERHDENYTYATVINNSPKGLIVNSNIGFSSLIGESNSNEIIIKPHTSEIIKIKSGNQLYLKKV